MVAFNCRCGALVELEPGTGAGPCPVCRRWVEAPAAVTATPAPASAETATTPPPASAPTERLDRDRPSDEEGRRPGGMPSRLGPYRVAGVIGQGGMGTVYDGYDDALGRRVAVKVLTPELARDASFVARFRQEARSAARLSHENLTHIYAIGESEGAVYFAMEFVEGETLAAVLDRAGALSSTEALEAAVQAAQGLRAADRRGVIHRDVKPSNLIRTPEGGVKVTDFGLAKRLGEEESGALTRTGTILGTPLYMSPEQARGDPTDRRSDIYGLGATLYHLLLGRPPFLADTPMGIAVKHVTEVLPPLPRERVPGPLAILVEHMLEKDPARRPQDYDQLLREMEQVREAIRPGVQVHVPEGRWWSRWVRPRAFLLPIAPDALKPAGILPRALALGLDALVLAPVILFDFALIWGLFDGVTRVPRGERLLFLVLIKGVPFLYFLLMHLRYGQTLGKMILGIQVVASDPWRAAGPLRLALRFVVSIGPILAVLTPDAARVAEVLEDAARLAGPLRALRLFCLLWLVVSALLILLTCRRRGLHDCLAGTVVVHRAIKAEERLEALADDEGPDPIRAAVLNIAPGLGPWFAGDRRRALVHAVVFLAALLVVILAYRLGARPRMRLLLHSGAVLLWALSMWDAYRVAKRIRDRRGQRF